MQVENYRDFWKFIRIMDDNDLLQHIVLVGSWVEYVYAQSDFLPGFSANLRTLDIDCLIKNMRRPTQPVSITYLLKNEGYTIDADVLEGTTKIYTPDLMEIEFIIEQKGKGDNSVIKTNLGVNAQALRHLSVVLNNLINISIFDFSIIVPTPEAYVAHKIIINKERGIKAEKDIQSIEGLIPYLNKEKFNGIYSQLTQKEQRTIKAFIEGKIHTKSKDGFLL